MERLYLKAWTVFPPVYSIFIAFQLRARVYFSLREEAACLYASVRRRIPIKQSKPALLGRNQFRHPGRWERHLTFVNAKKGEHTDV